MKKNYIYVYVCVLVYIYIYKAKIVLHVNYNASLFWLSWYVQNIDFILAILEWKKGLKKGQTSGTNCKAQYSRKMNALKLKR